MKKLLLSILAISLVACSSDDDEMMSSQQQCTKSYYELGAITNPNGTLGIGWKFVKSEQTNEPEALNYVIYDDGKSYKVFCN